MRARSFYWLAISLYALVFAGCDLFKEEEPPPELPVLRRPEPQEPVAAPAPPRDFWREQLLEPAQVQKPAPKETIVWHESLAAAADEIARDPRPIFILVRCPISERSGPDDDAILAGDGPLADLLKQCITISIGDALSLDLQRMNFPAYQDPDHTWWCWLMSPQWETYSNFGPRGSSGFPVSQTGSLAQWLTSALDYYYDARRGDWRTEIKSPHISESIPTPIDSSPRYATWKEKASELNRLRTQSNCLCCHQLQDAIWSTQLQLNRLTEWWIWPDESVLGMTFRETEPLVIDSVTEKSVAESAGLRPGDRIAGIRNSMKFGNWRMFSHNDFRTALHNLPWEDGQITFLVQREEAVIEVKLVLSNPQWRRYDLTWRKSLLESIHASHPGFLPTQAGSADRAKFGLPETTGMAIIPQIGPASPNFKRGLLPEHVIIQLGYVADNLSNEQFLAMFNILVPPGGQAPVLTISSRTGKQERIVIRGLSIFDIPRDAAAK